MSSAAVAAGSRRRRGRAVVLVNGAIALAVIAVVAAVALVVRPPAPPGIAEFAPQASKPITKAPPGQSSRFGNGAGQCANGQICVGTRPRAHAQPTSAPSASTQLGVPSALQCFTWPDGAVTQTFDPQSPPCIATWPGQAQGNGGSTTKGVTGSTIRIALPQETSNTRVADYQHIVDFFNSHFELYGRQITLVPFASAQDADPNAGSAQSATDQKADAQQASTLHAFAALDYVDGQLEIGALPVYLDTLASNHVVAVAGGQIAPAGTGGELVAHSPYEWTYQPTTDSLMAATASLICRQLVGHSAGHAPNYRTVKRKFGLVMPDPSLTAGAVPGQDSALRILSGCGIRNPPVVYYGDSDNSTSSTTTSMIRLKNDGVTSLLYYPYWGQAQVYSAQHVAGSIGYYPEWIVTGWQNWATAGLVTGDPKEAANSFGVAEWNKWLPLGQLPWYQSYLAGGGNATTAQSNLQLGEGFYHELLLLAAGIQMAGPHLTPDSFRAALQSTTFPDPGAGAAPSYQGGVGFSRSNFAMLTDYAAFWFDPSANSAQTAAAAANQAGDAYGNFCYVDLGRRWHGDGWPNKDAFFVGGCR